MISKEEIIKHIGAGVSWKWQSSFLWQSFLVNGQTPSYNTLDAQVSYTFNKINSNIGGMYYVTVQYGL